MSRSKGPSSSEPGHGKWDDRRREESSTAPFFAHGWEIYFHPLFVEQVERLASAVAGERVSPGQAPSFRRKTLRAILKLALDDIPQDPLRPEYRQGHTLGRGRGHWFRAKLGGGRFRLFFRFRADVRVIIYTWVNDEQTLRAYESRTDAYRVFARMLDSGNPADDWDSLLKAASAPENLRRARSTGEPPG